MSDDQLIGQFGVCEADRLIRRYVLSGRSRTEIPISSRRSGPLSVVLQILDDLGLLTGLADHGERVP